MGRTYDVRSLALLVLAGLGFLSTTNAYAGDETDCPAFVKEGKTWNCLQPADGGTCTYVIIGDTVIGGTGYKKVLCQDRWEYKDEGQHYFAAVREQGRQVFMVNGGQEQEYMLYDFEPYKEASLRYEWCGWGVSRNKGVPGWLRGVERHRFTVHPFVIDSDVQPSQTVFWFDGIGNVDQGPFSVGYESKTTLSCFEDGQLIYKHDDSFQRKEEGTGIAPTEVSCTMPGADVSRRIHAHDLQGRRLTSKPARGLYIEQGRKRVVR